MLPSVMPLLRETELEYDANNEFGMIIRNLFYEKRVLGDALHRLEQVGGERHSLNFCMSLAALEKLAEFDRVLMGPLDQRRCVQLPAAESNVRRHVWKLTSHQNIT